MDIFFDIRTLSLFSGLISACLFVCMIYVYKNRKTYSGFKQWTFAYILNFIGFIFLSLRSILPDFITVILANSLIVLCFVFITRGLIYFVEEEQHIGLDIAPIAVLILLNFFFLYISPNINSRIVVISLVIISINLRCVSIAHKKVPVILGEKNWLLITAFMWVALWLCVRVALTITHEDQLNNFMSSSIIQGVSIITGALGIILIAIGLIILNAQRLEKNLIKANKEIKTLSGLLPICSHCKKIRDDKGYWKQIDVYIQKHTEAKFSHGMCSECSDELYGKEDWYIEMKNKKKKKE